MTGERAHASTPGMVGVAQLVEHLVVVQDAAGSSPVTHPNKGRCAATAFCIAGAILPPRCPHVAPTFVGATAERSSTASHTGRSRSRVSDGFGDSGQSRSYPTERNHHGLDRTAPPPLRRDRPRGGGEGQGAVVRHPRGRGGVPGTGGFGWLAGGSRFREPGAGRRCARRRHHFAGHARAGRRRGCRRRGCGRRGCGRRPGAPTSASQSASSMDTRSSKPRSSPSSRTSRPARATSQAALTP